MRTYRKRCYQDAIIFHEGRHDMEARVDLLQHLSTLGERYGSRKAKRLFFIATAEHQVLQRRLVDYVSAARLKMLQKMSAHHREADRPSLFCPQAGDSSDESCWSLNKM
jgi:hypothetical protein